MDTANWKTTRTLRNEARFSPDGNLVTLNWEVGIVHHDRAGKCTNWPGREADRIPFGAIMCFQERRSQCLEGLQGVLQRRFGIVHPGVTS